MFKYLVASIFLLFSNFSFSQLKHDSKIIQIGDSQSEGIFGKLWAQRITSLFGVYPSINIYARRSSSPKSWLNYSELNVQKFAHYQDNLEIQWLSMKEMPPLAKLLNIQGDYSLIIQLGGNISRESILEVYSQVTALLRFVSKLPTPPARCFWIGPPNGHARPPKEQFDLFYASLRYSVERYDCKLIDSRLITIYPIGQGDGIHYDSILDSSLQYQLVEHWIMGLLKEIF